MIQPFRCGETGQSRISLRNYSAEYFMPSAATKHENITIRHAPGGDVRHGVCKAAEPRAMAAGRVSRAAVSHRNACSASPTMVTSYDGFPGLWPPPISRLHGLSTCDCSCRKKIIIKQYHPAESSDYFALKSSNDIYAIQPADNGTSALYNFA